MKINYDDNEYSWDIGIFREVDLNRSYWDSISYFKNYNEDVEIGNRRIAESARTSGCACTSLNTALGEINKYLDMMCE